MLIPKGIALLGLSPTTKCSCETYRKVLSDMKMSFVKLGEEECETCMMQDRHTHDNDDIEQCIGCNQWKKHIERARIAGNIR